MTAALTCALPGCGNPGDGQRPCPECLTAFGPYLAPIPTAPTREAIEDRDARARAVEAERQQIALRGRVGERKQNQTCWLCEGRRTCTRRPAGWECDTCLEVK